MNKSLLWKSILIIVLVVVAVWTLYPPDKTLKPGIDLAGGTSLIYEIDTQGLEGMEKKDLAQRMIVVLRRRIDPANIQNLVWRPQGGTRFEIQMPLASEETRQRRQDFEKARSDLLAENINVTVILSSLQKPVEQRTKDFEEFAQGSPDRMTILNKLADVYDHRKEIQGKRDKLFSELAASGKILTVAGLNLDDIKQHIGDWIKLDEQQLKDVLTGYLGSEGKLDMLTKYVNMYTEWAGVVEQLTNAVTGVNVSYREATKTLDKFNLTEEQLKFCLEMPPKSLKRNYAIDELKAGFPDRSEKIDRAIAAFDEYRPFQGRLDDPRDLQRMLKGAGILEFRILPAQGHAEVDADEMDGYVERLKTKGPKYASDSKNIWCEIENIDEFKRNDVYVAQFGDKFYVLASNKKGETLLHSVEGKDWSLKRAYPTTDQTGRRAIGFSFDEKGGRLFGEITGKNIDRPLCILLDGVAISAPNINSVIFTHGIIQGSFTQIQVVDMVNKLNAGSLPARLIEQPISVKTIGPSIGADNRDKGIRSGLIGLAGTMLCMAIYYTLGGAIADVALLMNLLFTLAIMALLRATFTLPGIAGAILTIGMSVDANVLIFERIREEQQKGVSLRGAIKNGYEKAFSAIFDSNITTIMTAAILYWVGSEEIKGFALVLMLGLSSSLFTALFVTRTIFDWLLAKRIIKDHLVMLNLIHRPNINWMSLRPVFFTISAILTIGGVAVFLTRDDTKNNKYDIEFTGGTSIQINLKDDANLDRRIVEDRIHKAGTDAGSSGLAAASVYSIGTSGKQYEITTTETNKTKASVTFPQAGQTIEAMAAAIKKAAEKKDARLSNLVIIPVSGTATEFTVTTSQLNTFLVGDVLKIAFPDASVSQPQVDEIVNDAVLTAFANELKIQQNLQPEIVSQEKLTQQIVDSYPALVDFIGGIKITCNIERAATAEEINRRLADLRFKPDMQNLNWYSYKILSSDMTTMEPNQPVKSFVYLGVEPEAGFRELSEDEWAQFVKNETDKVLAATEMEASLPRVTQIDPSVGEEAKTRALVAIVLSLIAILIYIWVRFGDLHFGFGAIITLFHDTCVTVGMVTACTYIAATTIGQKLLIGDFKIDLAMIAAFLTLLGYSINDTIVIYDRIRENRRKGTLTPQIINNSINETLSRTLLTSTTTLLVLIVMYIFGGTGLRGFNFAMLFGIILGTYSSIAISAPVLLLRFKTTDKKAKAKEALPAKPQPAK
ncbi:MAG: protein translocase subunit SecD [Phycisphaerae bacterium]|nr:protein translocase subunit SecD [Phycisphaerae bacterium]MDD5381194.1 protein translocase subunit SecD [Phycisphaerae bacterium]